MKKPCFQICLKTIFSLRREGEAEEDCVLFPYNVQSSFFGLSSRVNVQHRYTDISLCLFCKSHLLYCNSLLGKMGLSMWNGCLILWSVSPHHYCFSSHQRINSGLGVKLWCSHSGNFLLLLLFINDNKIIICHYLCIGWFVLRAWLWVCKSLKWRIGEGTGPAKFRNLN